MCWVEFQFLCSVHKKQTTYSALLEALAEGEVSETMSGAGGLPCTLLTTSNIWTSPRVRPENKWGKPALLAIDATPVGVFWQNP